MNDRKVINLEDGWDFMQASDMTPTRETLTSSSARGEILRATELWGR